MRRAARVGDNSPDARLGREPDLEGPAGSGRERSLKGSPQRVESPFHAHVDVRRAADGPSADADVEVLRVLADHERVQLPAAPGPDRQRNARVAPRGAQIDVLVEVEAQVEQDSPFEDSRTHARVSDSPEQQRVASGHFVDRRIGQNLAGLQVMSRAERVVRPFDAEGMSGGRRLDDLPGFRDDLGSDAVSREARDGVSPAFAHRARLFASSERT